MRVKTSGWFTLLLLFWSTPAHPYELFRIIAGSCDFSQGSAILSGFSNNSDEAIFTALHGVAGCKDIVAERFSGSAMVGRETGFRISHVDVRHDVAILMNSTRNRATLPQNPVPTVGQRVFVSGFPRGISAPDTLALTVGDPSTRPLRSMLGSDMIEQFRKVGSPAMDINILRVDGNAQKGHSGAPVLDQNGGIVGVLIGGFDSGEFGTSWAALMTDLSFSNAGKEVAVIAQRRHRFSVGAGTVPISPAQQLSQIAKQATKIRCIQSKAYTALYFIEQDQDGSMSYRNTRTREHDWRGNVLFEKRGDGTWVVQAQRLPASLKSNILNGVLEVDDLTQRLRIGPDVRSLELDRVYPTLNNVVFRDDPSSAYLKMLQTPGDDPYDAFRFHSNLFNCRFFR